MLVDQRGEASLAPPCFCDVLTSRLSRYRLRRFEPWASAQRLMARLEFEVFPNKLLSTTCFHNHPISRNALASGSIRVPRSKVLCSALLWVTMSPPYVEKAIALVCIRSSIAEPSVRAYNERRVLPISLSGTEAC